MARYVMLSLVLLLPAVARANDSDAKTLAQDILTKGAALFDTRDAAAMAATYLEDADLTIISKDDNTGKFKNEMSRGRSAIERAYQDFFKDRKPGTTSRNHVTYAHFVGNDMLIIHGNFNLDTSQEDYYPFVQIRLKQGDKWLIQSLQFVVVAERNR